MKRLKAHIPMNVRHTYWRLREARSGHFFVRQFLWEWACRLPEFRITRTTKHGRLSFSSRDMTIGRWLFVKGGFEHYLIERALSVAIADGHLKQTNGGYLLDIGANIGTVCVHLVRKGLFAAALAIEPIPSNYSMLRRNIRLNSLERSIMAVDCAVSSVAGSCVMELAPGNSGDCRIRREGSSLQATRMGEARWPTLTVSVSTVDEVMSRAGVEPNDVKLLWMDVQGHETHVLEGAHRLLERSSCPVVMEFWPYGLARAGVTEREFLACVVPRFESFYDLATPSPGRIPIAELSALFGVYTGFESSNLLLVR